MSEPPISEQDFQQLARVRQALREFVRGSELAARAAGLTPRQHEALLAVRGTVSGRPATVGHVAAALQIRHHSAVGLLDRLEEKGYVARRAGTVDRRQVLLEVTERGTAVLDRLTEAHRQELRRVGPQLVAALSELVVQDEA